MVNGICDDCKEEHPVETFPSLGATLCLACLRVRQWDAEPVNEADKSYLEKRTEAKFVWVDCSVDVRGKSTAARCLQMDMQESDVPGHEPTELFTHGQVRDYIELTVEQFDRKYGVRE